MIRMLLSLLLTLTLAATSVRAAVMHSEMQGAYQMVICADSTLAQTTLTFDATGKPITAHHCPDCTTAFSGLPQSPLQIAAAPATSRTLHPGLCPASATAQLPNLAARDPPFRA
ncbi:hypothetical protein GCM10010873_05230 [Cypionkella aquatica]|uniref:DUF2946 domain-containing protein n=1 Tax=Cypionkella aquatica TaxID=1756042 RepID=A0AA37X0B3_9RHOB|nr:hypothetical protein [Cypionkella aquatica]GLS85550.1 hypothetical protein GCM10010873_05230 [Cypionkella aquatica]